MSLLTLLVYREGESDEVICSTFGGDSAFSFGGTNGATFGGASTFSFGGNASAGFGGSGDTTFGGCD